MIMCVKFEVSLESNSVIGVLSMLAGFSALRIQGGIMRNRRVVNMCMGMPGDDSFFKSSLVQNEIGRLQADYKNLLQIVRPQTDLITED